MPLIFSAMQSHQQTIELITAFSSVRKMTSISLALRFQALAPDG